MPVAPRGARRLKGPPRQASLYVPSRSRSRFGRRRPCLVAALPLLLIGFTMVWTTPRSFGGAAEIVWLGVALLLFFTALV